MSFEGIEKSDVNQVEIDPVKLTKLREVFASEIEDRITTPGFNPSQKMLEVPDAVRRGEQIPLMVEHGMSLEGAFMMKAQDFRFTPDEIDAIKKIVFSQEIIFSGTKQNL